ncbi:MAG: hypothetical protein K2X78_09400, partial [Burkholderiaceae bacterium]|nr:hypothetical protein [Burkholderiaceae bacterium]
MAKRPKQFGPIRRCAKFSEYGGLAGIAGQLQERYASVDWPPGARSLYNELVKLDNGDTVW